MSGIEELRKRMKELGASSTQCNSPTVGILLAIFADNEHAEDALKCLNDLKEEASRVIREKGSMAMRLEWKRQELEHRENELAKRVQEVAELRAQIEKVAEDILRCETPEGRDRQRLAEIYNRTVLNARPRMDSYEMQRYITGLSRILAGSDADGGQCPPLQKEEP